MCNTAIIFKMLTIITLTFVNGWNLQAGMHLFNQCTISKGTKRID